MKSNKKLIVIISIVVVLAVASIIFVYLFLNTNILKTKKELFGEYFAQNEEVFKKIIDLKTLEIYEKMESENNYESNTSIKMTHSEGGEISSPLNNLAIKLHTQKDNEQQYLYLDGQILYEDEKHLEAEIIKEQDIYGIRFTDAVKQFITIKNDEKLENVANNLEVEVSQLQEILNLIDGNVSISGMQELHELKDKYVNIITTAISNGTFSKQKNAMITYNNVTTETNAYSVELSSQQIENLLIEILENIKNETEILEKLEIPIEKEEYTSQIDEKINWISGELELPTVKFTVYEKDEQTIRTVVEIGLNKIIIENVEQNGEIKTNINYSNNETAMVIDFEIIKKNIDGQENFDISIDISEGEENHTINFSNQMQEINNEINIDTEISYKQNITTMSLVLENKFVIGDEFEKVQVLGTDNNITLNELEEEKMKEIINILKQIVPQDTSDRIERLKQKIGIGTSNAEGTETENQITQVEINKFNSKFEFYTGDEVSYENVKLLLDIAKNHLQNYEVEEIVPEDIENPREDDKKISIKLSIEKDIQNEEGINEILGKIEEKNREKYKVLIFYKEENGLIDYITITEI